MANVEPTLVENDSSIICGSGSTERPLFSDADSVDDLKRRMFSSIARRIEEHCSLSNDQ